MFRVSAMRLLPAGVLPGRSGATRLGNAFGKIHPTRRLLSSFYDDDDDDDDGHGSGRGGPPKTALIIGSSGSLGRTLSRYLSQEHKVRVVGADVVPPHPDDERIFADGGFIRLPLFTVNDDDKDKNQNQQK